MDSEDPPTPNSGLKASPALARNYMNAKEKQAQDILDDIGNDLELQLIIKDVIEIYKLEKIAATSQGLSVGDIVQNTVESRKGKADDISDSDGEDPADEDGDASSTLDDVPLHRKSHIFGSWNGKFINQCFANVDPKCMTGKVLKTLKLQSKREALELGFDIKVFGDSLDGVGTTNKKELVAAMKRVYHILGRRWQYLEAC